MVGRSKRFIGRNAASLALDQWGRAADRAAPFSVADLALLTAWERLIVRCAARKGAAIARVEVGIYAGFAAGNQGLGARWARGLSAPGAREQEQWNREHKREPRTHIIR